jgi:hypothetical protein
MPKILFDDDWNAWVTESRNLPPFLPDNRINHDETMKFLIKQMEILEQLQSEAKSLGKK